MTKSKGINRPRHIWTEAERAQLRALYPDLRGEDVAAIMGISMSSVHQMAVRLRIGKSEAFKASAKSGRVQRGLRNANMIANQFKPGQKPWNTGTHYVAGGRSAETRFKKGEMSGAAQHNYVPIGSTRTCKDGYLERKVTDDPALVPARRWVGVHRLVWQAAHGPIPKGYMVVFKPGQRTAVEADITVDRLECISRQENAKRNSFRRGGPEMARLYQLKGAITRQVNRIKKQQEERA